MITLMDTAREDFKKDRKGVKVFESLCDLLCKLELLYNTEGTEGTLKAIKDYIKKTQEIEFVQMRPYEYKVFYKGKTYYIDVLENKIQPSMTY